MAEKTTTLRQTVQIPATPEEVYQAYLNANQHAAFTGAQAASEARVGGTMSTWNGYIVGRYLELEYARRIVQEWTTSEWPEEYPPSVLELTFHSDHEGTLIEMVQSRVPSSQAEFLMEGWVRYYWDRLRSYFQEKGQPGQV